jgi:methionyl-tRNA synthetase
MNEEDKKFYVTTPIYYANDQPHLGHAYTTVAADVLTRYYNQFKKRSSFFLTGTDEHGNKIEKAAKKNKKEPQEFCNEVSSFFKKTWDDLDVSYGRFIRTTDKDHVKAVQNALQILYDKGFIYKGLYKGLYCSGCEQYKAESDLIEGKCPDHQTKPELIEEESYLFRLKNFESKLREKIEKDEFIIRPEQRKNEMLSFIDQGLKDISISRKNVKWGIPLPFDKKFTAYVWVDALLNYLTGLGWRGDSLEFKNEFWPADLQLMSKDILRVHATIWPALLLALDVPLPKKIFIHGYFTINEQKMSKSIGNVIWPGEMIEKFGSNATRYLLLFATPFGKDGDISWEKLIEKYNADLANGIGNTISRVLSMVEKYYNGEIPETNSVSELKDWFWDDCYPSWSFNIEELHFERSLNIVISLFKKIDEDIERFKPWEKSKEEIKNSKAKSKFNEWLELIRLSSWLILPFMPAISDSIFKQIGLNSKEEVKRDFNKDFSDLISGTKIKKDKNLFSKKSKEID